MAISSGVAGGILSGCAISSAASRPLATSLQPASAFASVSERGRGQIDCFVSGTTREDDPTVPASCETSAVVRTKSKFWVASDKPLPHQKNASIFGLEVQKSIGSVRKVPDSELQQFPFAAMNKIEAMAHAPEDGWVFACTAFDRMDESKASLDAYNILLAWPEDAPQNAHIVASSTRDGIASSMALRRKIQTAMSDDTWPEGPPYFKVEGLAALPGNRLLFGVRESGASYKKFDYQIRLLEANYDEIAGQIQLDLDSLREIYRAPATMIEDHRVAVSSLLYDPKREWVWMLTSFEASDDVMGAYLMVASAQGLGEEAAWHLVTSGPQNKPFVFANKAEGMTFVEDDSLLVVFDEDRRVNDGPTPNAPTQVARAPNQGAYMLLRIHRAHP